MENALNKGAAYGVDKSGQERRAFGNKNKMPGFLGKLFGLKKPDVPPPGAPAGAAPPATGAFAGGAAGMQQGAMPAMQGNTQQQNQMQPPGPGMAPGPGMMQQQQQQQQQQPQENIMPGGHNMMGQNQQYNGQQAAPVASNAQFKQQQFQQEDAKINQMVNDSMKTVTCQMLDGTTQEYPYIVAKQLEEQGLCKIAPEPAPMVNYGAGQGMMYNQENQYSQGMMMNGQQMQQHGFGSAMGMNLPMNSQMGAMADEMVELELPNGEIKMVTKSQAEQMGCIPVPDYPPQQQQQAMMGANQSGFYNMGGGVPIGPAVIVDQGPEYGRTLSVANINATQQRQVTVPVQSTIMQPRSTTTTIMPSQQSTMSFNQPQQSMSIMQPQTTTIQRSMTMLQPSMQTTVSVANPMGMASMPSYDDPVVQVILPSGESQMMPKSQALQLQQQLQAGGGSQAMPISPGYGVGNAYENQWDGYGGSPPSVPWGQDIGDM